MYSTFNSINRRTLIINKLFNGKLQRKCVERSGSLASSFLFLLHSHIYSSQTSYVSHVLRSAADEAFYIWSFCLKLIGFLTGVLGVHVAEMWFVENCNKHIWSPYAFADCVCLQGRCCRRLRCGVQFCIYASFVNCASECVIGMAN
jgi:hypothetical protein